MHAFKVTHGHDEQPTIENAIYQVIGYGSVCWSNVEGAGGFNSSAASEAGKVAIAEIRDILHTRLTMLLDVTGTAVEWNAAIEAALRIVEGQR